jgi:putative tryptophan/tyrosine transport system substrate-binding protein
LPDTFSQVHRAAIILLAARNKVPAAYCDNSFAVDGGLFSYGPDQVDIFRRAAPYVDRILKGEKPADLPVQAPTKYVLTINLKTARALGLDVPPTLLARADEVIEQTMRAGLLHWMSPEVVRYWSTLACYVLNLRKLTFSPMP